MLVGAPKRGAAATGGPPSMLAALTAAAADAGLGSAALEEAGKEKAGGARAALAGAAGAGWEPKRTGGAAAGAEASAGCCAGSCAGWKRGETVGADTVMGASASIDKSNHFENDGCASHGRRSQHASQGGTCAGRPELRRRAENSFKAAQPLIILSSCELRTACRWRVLENQHP